MYALGITSSTHLPRGNYPAAKAQLDELIALAEQKGALHWKAVGMSSQGQLFALTSKTSDAVRMLTSGITAYRSTGTTAWKPISMSNLTRAYAAVDQFDDAWGSIGDAITAGEKTKEGGGKPKSIVLAGKSR